MPMSKPTFFPHPCLQSDLVRGLRWLVHSFCCGVWGSSGSSVMLAVRSIDCITALPAWLWYIVRYDYYGPSTHQFSGLGWACSYPWAHAPLPTAWTGMLCHDPNSMLSDNPFPLALWLLMFAGKIFWYFDRYSTKTITYLFLRLQTGI